MNQGLQFGVEGGERQDCADAPSLKISAPANEIAVTLLTGGIDRPYVFGLAMELLSKGASVDVIGSDSLDFPEFHGNARMNFLNLQGSQRPNVSSWRKVLRLSKYYVKLLRYSAIAKPRIFHILWNNKLELFDRTLLTLYFRLLGKKIVLTVHNVNKGKRDSKDTYLNRITLQIQYRIADHIFVHTESGKVELREEFGVQASKVTVIPFGINNAVPKTKLSPSEARQRLGIQDRKKTILFFGRITKYKGLEYLVAAFRKVVARCDDYRLIVAGRPENDFQESWSAMQEAIREDVQKGRILLRADHIPDDETEIYFKAADVLILPYRQIYQSGVLYLGYSFGLPILASDLGALKDEIIEGKTGFTFRSEDPDDLSKTIERYFASDLFLNLNSRRQEIIDFAQGQHSWDLVGDMVISVYANLIRIYSRRRSSQPEGSESSHNSKAPHKAFTADPD